MILSRATRPPPLSPWQMFPVRELAQRFSGNIFGAGHPGRRISSNVSLHFFRATNLLNIVNQIFILKTILALELSFLQCSGKTAGIGFSFDVVASGLLVENSVQSPAYYCASSLYWKIQVEVIFIRETQRSEHNNSQITFTLYILYST